MATKIFVNLPVKNLQKSIEFYTKLGYTFNPQFTGETAACMIISEDIYAMLGTHENLKSFTKKEICDTTKYTSALISLTCESRAQVDELVAKAIAAGGSTASEPTDHGFMYSHDYEDLDGNGWGLFWMDPGAINQS
ncbi:MAG: VOC family protein [Blastocatellales bacterium]